MSKADDGKSCPILILITKKDLVPYTLLSLTVTHPPARLVSARVIPSRSSVLRHRWTQLAPAQVGTIQELA